MVIILLFNIILQYLKSIKGGFDRLSKLLSSYLFISIISLGIIANFEVTDVEICILRFCRWMYNELSVNKLPPHNLRIVLKLRGYIYRMRLFYGMFAVDKYSAVKKEFYCKILYHRKDEGLLCFFCFL